MSPPAFVPSLRVVVLFACCALCEWQCQTVAHVAPNDTDTRFGAYWHDGKAELSSYTLTQARYREMHEGEAVLVFVTEPFSKRKQVKLDFPDKAGNDAVEVMKLNLTRKFTTGIYPYSMLTSVFTPVQPSASELHPPNSIKTTMTMQEWCGNVFMQVSKRGGAYEVQGFSYFETEGDTRTTLPTGVYLEDEIFTLIRLHPDRLPLGNIRVLPALTFLRLNHRSAQVVEAIATRTEQHDTCTYTLTTAERRLDIHFIKAFPYTIEGWEETYSDFGRVLTTRATRKKTIRLDYWMRHTNDDRRYRDSLGLH